MDLKKQKKLAARTLGVSPKRVKLNLEGNEEAKKQLKELISREGVRELLEEKIIQKKPKKGISRTRANKILVQKKKGRRQGHGSRKGTAKTRTPPKETWMVKIRALRKLLKEYRENGILTTKQYRELYLKAKGNFFRNKRHMILYMQQHDLIKRGIEDRGGEEKTQKKSKIKDASNKGTKKKSEAELKHKKESKNSRGKN